MTWLLDCPPPSSISWRRFNGARDASMTRFDKTKADYGVFICEANVLFYTIEARNEVVVKVIAAYKTKVKLKRLSIYDIQKFIQCFQDKRESTINLENYSGMRSCLLYLKVKYR
ncbi:unnamed protein product [Pocillopora meandrina]|uniref:Uncharacterized protein n=1 Tax=Pocillopora meandrina TaxID=46732 RepID=A0AAU9X9U5_9CNID|nr:unnamed protein product [Pocillopora meandrina]